MRALLAILALWLFANLLHGLWVALRRRQWEMRVVRNAQGLLADAVARTLGDGEIGVLMIHGFADTPAVWQRMMGALATTGRYTCRAMRLPGAAEPASMARRQSLALWRAEVEAELLALRAKCKGVWIAGHSLGGALAIDAALRHPEIVDGLALFAPLVAVSRKRSPLLPPHLWFGLARVLLCLSPVFESPFAPTSTALDDPTFTCQRDRFIPFGVYRGLFALISENRFKAALIQCPIFAAVAGRDSVVDSRATLAWLAGCHSRKCIHELPECSHVVLMEPGWQQFCGDWQAFIAG